MPTIERRGITLVGVALGNLDDDSAVQLALPLMGSGGSIVLIGSAGLARGAGT